MLDHYSLPAEGKQQEEGADPVQESKWRISDCGRWRWRNERRLYKYMRACICVGHKGGDDGVEGMEGEERKSERKTTARKVADSGSTTERDEWKENGRGVRGVQCI